MTSSVHTSAAHPGESHYEKFTLSDGATIRRHLQQLIDKRCTLTARCQGGSAGMLTALLALDGERMWVDVPPGPTTLKLLLASPQLAFDGVMDRITLRFMAGPAEQTTLHGQRALVMPQPTRLLHLQRREFLRRAPPAGALQCHVPHGDGSRMTATIRDIGAGGMAVLAPDAMLSLTPGQVLPGCVIDLPDDTSVEVTLRVCHVFTVTERGRELRQAGFEFVAPPTGTQTRLFGYVMQLEREQRARQRELGLE